ncbi:MAG: HAD hydrolase-like protein [Spirochaetia bacterium]|nr:HAD hydrolase-like protein [Spirochaetales bacterium]MDX9783153.1 HAD hydrolase-like protein [Spirochaetia bacterium]
MKVRESYDNLMFDLDGTLTDSKPGLVNAVEYAVRKMGLAPLPSAIVDMFLGPPLFGSFEKYCGMDRETAKAAVSCFREYYAEKGVFENEPFEGVTELLKALKASEKRLFVATSKPTVTALQVCLHFDIDGYFTEILGSELDGSIIEKHDIVGLLLSRHALDRSRTLMIGDRENDIAGGRKNGLDTAAVGYGYGSEDELRQANASYYVKTMSDLRALLLD